MKEESASTRTTGALQNDIISHFIEQEYLDPMDDVAIMDFMNLTLHDKGDYIFVLAFPMNKT